LMVLGFFGFGNAAARHLLPFCYPIFSGGKL
jgi:hypothetical protein